MSKIEDALKKAVNSGEIKYPGEIFTYDKNNISQPSLGRDLVIVNGGKDAVQKKRASIKEIALMNNENLLKENQLADMKIISPDMTDDKIANSYRDLRTKILKKTQGRNAVVLVTSCSSGDEGGLAALNIATAFSFDESKTSILVDCDINNPRIDTYLNKKSNCGLTDYLEGENIKEDQIIHETGIKRLRIIPAGIKREIATEYFTSLKMKRLIEDLFSRYPERYIFINSSPISESADTKILVELCDYVLLVVPYGKSTIHKIKESVSDIDSSKLLGIVFTDKPKLPKKMKFGSLFFSWFKR